MQGMQGENNGRKMGRVYSQLRFNKIRDSISIRLCSTTGQISPRIRHQSEGILYSTVKMT